MALLARYGVSDRWPGSWFTFPVKAGVKACKCMLWAAESTIKITLDDRPAWFG